MRGIIFSLILGILLLGFAPVLTAVEVGENLPALTFKDIRYLPRTFEDFGERKAFVILFVNRGDEHSEAAIKKLSPLRDAHLAHDIEVILMNSGTTDSIMDAAMQAIDLDVPYTVLKDRDASVAQAIGVTATGTTVILDSKETLRYRGNVDGAAEAVQALLASEALPVSASKKNGTAITVRKTPKPAGDITYSEHIAPIMNTHCVECHRPGETAPFSLRSYGQVSTRADMINEVVQEERMPPWYGHQESHDIVNIRELSQQEKDHIAQWYEGGRLEGDPALKPPAREFPITEWKIGEPDLVLTAPEEFEVPADGYIPYEYVILPYRFEEDTWVQAIQIKPSNRAVVHHANLAYTKIVDGKQEEGYHFVTGQVPGGSPAIMDANQAMLIPANSVLLLQIHYVTTGQIEKEQIRVGIRYAKEEIHKRVYHQRVRPKEINIEAGSAFHAMTASETIDANATILALFSHMHLRGRDMKFIVDYPEGKSETLMTVPNYSFDWQLAYKYAIGAKEFPKGTTVRTISHYDNSAFNAYNPNPDDEVHYGAQTFHEMNDAYIFYLDNDETLSLQVDPQTGHVIDGQQAKAN